MEGQEQNLSRILVKKEPKPVEIEFEGEMYKFKIRDLSWAERNLIISRSVSYKGGGAVIDLDAYFRQSLQEMIVEAPWPKERTAIVLKELGGKFGELLQAYVPSPFGETSSSGEEIPKK